MSNIDFHEQDRSVAFAVRVIPRASKSEIVGEQDGTLKVRLKAPPVNGAANEELVRLLAREFGVAKRQIDLLSGQASKNKRVRITDIDPAAVLAVLKGKT